MTAEHGSGLSVPVKEPQALSVRFVTPILDPRLIRAYEEHPVVFNDADAKTIKPARAAHEIFAECWIVGEENYSRELDAKSMNRNLVFVRFERTRHRAEPLRSS